MTAPFLSFVTAEFPAAEGEDEELVNEGLYGRNLCQFLRDGLTARGWSVPAFLPEDWGWWLELDVRPARLALCVYGQRREDGTTYAYAVTPSVSGSRWRRSRTLPAGELERLLDDVEDLLRGRGVTDLRRTDDFPW